MCPVRTSQVCICLKLSDVPKFEMSQESLHIMWFANYLVHCVFFGSITHEGPLLENPEVCGMFLWTKNNFEIGPRVEHPSFKQSQDNG